MIWSPQPVRVRDDLPDWLASIKKAVGGRILAHLEADTDGLDRHLECAAVAEIPGAYLFCTFYQAQMNDTFTRLGLYMGAGRGQVPDTLLPHDAPLLLNYKKLVAGHNLPGVTIRRFFADPRVRGLLGLNEDERDLHRSFVQSERIRAHGDQFYVIALSIQNIKTYQEVVSHEILHAQYHLTPGFSALVDDFWRTQVSPPEQAQIRDILGRSYNVDDDAIVIDEFQAYLLQTNAERDQMRAFVPRFRKELLQRLEAHGLGPLQIA